MGSSSASTATTVRTPNRRSASLSPRARRSQERTVTAGTRSRVALTAGGAQQRSADHLQAVARAELVREQRQQTLNAAYATHPERFARRPRAPKLPDEVWTNPPTGQNDPTHPMASQPEAGAAAIAPTTEHTSHPRDRHGNDPQRRRTTDNVLAELAERRDA